MLSKMPYAAGVRACTGLMIICTEYSLGCEKFALESHPTPDKNGLDTRNEHSSPFHLSFKQQHSYSIQGYTIAKIL